MKVDKHKAGPKTDGRDKKEDMRHIYHINEFSSITSTLIIGIDFDDEVQP